MSNSIFQNTGVNTPPRSVFDLSYTKKFTTDFGRLYPIACDELVPGDSFDIKVAINVKTQPLLAPVMHEVNIYTHWFFVPYRLLWSGWTEFIFGGKSGDSNINPDGSFKKLLPRVCRDYDSFALSTGQVDQPKVDTWLKTIMVSPSAYRYYYPSGDSSRPSLWDAFGFPTACFFPGDSAPIHPYNNSSFVIEDKSVSPSKFDNDLSAPLLFPWLAYHLVYFNYYVDENLDPDYDPNTFNIEEYFKTKYNYKYSGVPHFEYEAGYTGFNWFRYRCFEKDYFTSCLPWQQRGTSPALPISLDAFRVSLYQTNPGDPLPTTPLGMYANVSSNGSIVGDPNYSFYDGTGLAVSSQVATSFDISDLRLAVQVQRFKELSARVGARYNEQIKGHFNVNMGDDRLQRPEYIGGSKQSLIIGEVFSTVESESPLASYAGTAQSNDISDIGSYYAPEHGLILGLMSIMPRPNYNQGINRQWLRRNMYDFYSPEFSHLSEQGVEQAEIYSNGVYSDDSKIFGFQGRYNEMRCKQNLVCGDLRDTFNFWHLNRQFASAPLLNTSFMECRPTRNDLHRIFAVQDVDPFIVQCANIIRAVRPLPEMAIPGLLDHV